MESFIESLVIDAPAESIWSVIADYGRDPEWRSGVVSMTIEPTGAIAAGASTHEVIRVAGRTYRNSGVIDHVVRGSTIEWHTTSGAEARGARSVRALAPDRCAVTLELHVVPRGLNRLFAPVLRRMLRANLHRDLAELAALTAAVPASA
jgi:uncharacterized membrane protein